MEIPRLSDGAHLIFYSDSGEAHVLDLIADEWFKERTARPGISFSHVVKGRDAAILRGLLLLAQEWLDDPGNATEARR